MNKSQVSLIEITAIVKVETEKGLLLFDGAREAWVPKSQVEENADGTFTMPEKLALEKGFI